MNPKQRNNIETMYPLSPMQQGMLFHTLYAPDAGVDFEQLCCRLQGELDLTAFQKAWEYVIRRHPVLRTAFNWERRDDPFQIVYRQVKVPWEIQDWTRLSADEQATALESFLRADRIRGFDLGRPPLLRLTLFQLQANTYQLLISIHHILLDGWSLSRVLNEVLTCYAALSQDQNPNLPPVRPFRDFITWLQSRDLEQAETFWRHKLGNITAPTPLTVDREYPDDSADVMSAQLQQTLPLDLSLALQSLAKHSRVTINTLLQAAWSLLLSRYSGEQDVVYGMTVAGRPPELSQVESMIGLFINTLPMRAHVPATQRLGEWLQALQAEAAEFRQYEYSPLSQVQGWSGVTRGTPLFQSIVVFENYPVDTITINAAGRLAVEDLRFIEHNNYPLAVIAWLSDAGALSIRIKYARERFSSAVIERMLGHLQTLLRGMVQTPDCLVGSLDLLTEAERHQQVVTWNATHKSYPHDRCLHQLVEDQVARTPAAPAVIFENQTLSYAELNGRANQLAYYLQGQGIGPESRVGIYLEHSLEMVIAMLGVFKAGGAYVPLDPDYPAERLQYMLADSHPSVLITRPDLSDHFPDYQGAVLCLPTDWERIADQPTTNPSSAVLPDNLACILYTSGSTGTPKAAMNTHRGLGNRILWAQDVVPLDHSDRLLKKASFSFDVSVWKIIWPLIAGAQLVLARQGGNRDSRYLIDLINEQQITVVHFGPAMLSAMLSEPDLPQCSSLRCMFCGGEALTRDLQDRYFRTLSIPLYNQYGPTETSAHVTCWPCRPTLEAERGSSAPIVPLGRPMPNVKLYILDSDLRPVPIGVPGELYIGGIEVGRGYLNHPAATAEKYIPHPFVAEIGATPGQRMYRTGDRVRYREDGVIEFLERIDHQVKIRGFRVEPGEIEAVLRQHPAVLESVVIAREDTPGVKRLVAYLIPAPQRQIVTSELYSFVRSKLPEYMVPAAFVELERLPLSPNGKVDRAALPAPSHSRPDLLTEYTTPRTETEALLAQIWARELKLDRVGVTDNFFELGGDSILSIQIVARARQQGLDLSPRLLFLHQSIAELALHTQPLGTATHAAAPQPTTGPVPLTPIQHEFFARQLPNPQHYNQALLLALPQPLDPAALHQALQALVAHHDALRLRFTPSASGWQQQVAPPTDQPLLDVVDLSAVPPAERAAVMQQHFQAAQTGLDLADGPLLRAVLVPATPEQDARLLLVAHHLVVDGVSWRILLADLHTAYQQMQASQPVQLGAVATPFGAWAQQLHAYAQQDTLRADADFWLRRPAHAPTLPLDQPGGANTVASTQRLTRTLPVAETQALLQTVPAVYHTQINDVLLTALVQAVAPWAGATGLLVDLEGHGREPLDRALDVTRTVGWFTTYAPLWLDLDGDTGPGTALKQLKEQLRQVPQRGLSYGLLRYLREDAEVQAALVALPRPQLSFNYLGQWHAPGDDTAAWSLVDEPHGPIQDPAGTRTHMLAVSAAVVDGALQVQWSYSDQLHEATTIAALADAYQQALAALITHCLSPDAGGFTPSDFPLARIDQEQLDRLQAHYPIEDLYPLTPLQQGMLFHSLYAPTSGVYCTVISYTLHGPIDSRALNEAWQQVIRRHAVLRTAYVWEGLPEPLQVVLRDIDMTLAEHDWRHLTQAEQQQQLQTLIDAEHERGFDLRQAPAMRLTLVAGGPELFYCLWTVHHILMDGWSLPLIFSEVFRYYQAARQHTSIQPMPTRPYRDFIAWLQAQDLRQAEAYWRAALKDWTTPTPLIVDQTSRTHTTAQGLPGEVLYELSPELSDRLQVFLRNTRVTASTVIQSAWALLLSRYSGQNDVVTGVTVSGRPADLDGVESMIGLFINTLPLRVRIDPAQAVADWLHLLQAQAAELRQFEYTPLVQIQAWSEIPHGTPLFESIVVFENYPVDTVTLDHESDVRPGEMRIIDHTNYPLSLIAWQATSGRFVLRFNYDRQRFSQDTVERIHTHLETLLAGMIADPARPVGAVPLLPADEYQRVVYGWNATTLAYPEDACLHELFEQQAVRTPDALAVIGDGEQLSYAALNAQANQLAHHLRTLGVTPETVVAVALDRSPALLVALLAVLKAGAAYVPLDPSAPPARWHTILAETAAPVLLTQASFRDRLPQLPIPALCLDTDVDAWAAAPDATPAPVAQPTNLAYVIYTSGSTGQPKGAMNSHRAIVSHCAWAQAAFPLSTADRMLHKTPIGFDVSVWELFWPLTTGAALVLARPDGHKDPQYLAQRMADTGVTTVHFVPAMLRAFLTADLAPLHGQLRHLFCSGEALPTALAAEAADRLGCAVHNLYGPSEAAVDVTAWTLSPTDTTTHVPLGHPVANTQVYVLDAALQPVPIGVVGELYLGGVQLGRGYYAQPVRTAAAFVPDPFGGTPGARLYRTGDQGRWRRDGVLEYLGRQDDQVKVRGVRIELGEVAAALAAYPGVQAQAVLALPSEDTTTLVAYVVAPADTLDVGALRSFLRERLSEAMLPSAIVRLDALPLLPNGKLDRRALPAPSAETRLKSRKYQAPRTEIEATLATIVADVLKLDRVGIYDNFFELGGHSLLLTQVAFRIRSELDVELPLQRLFEAPTLADLAARIEEQHDEDEAELARLLEEIEELSDEETEERLRESEETR